MSSAESSDWWGRTTVSWLYHTCCNVCDSRSLFRNVYRLLCCPLRCLCGALRHGRRDGQQIYSQVAVLYVYVLFLVTSVFNIGLVVAKPSNATNGSQSAPPVYKYVLVGYTVSYMWVSIVALGYIAYQAHGHGALCERSAMRRTFYMRTGLYIFGLLSCGYNACSAMNTVVCHEQCCGSVTRHVLYPFSDLTLALFTVLQILFLNSYYMLRLPVRTPYVQIAYAHLLGANLGLWIWTLCREVDSSYDNLCNSFPVSLDERTRRIFYVVTVEYLLLVAVMFFENWSLLRTQRDFPEVVQNELGEMKDAQGEAAIVEAGEDAAGVSGGTPLVFAFVATLVFLILVIASSEQGKTYNVYYDAYLWCMLAFYITQIIACAIIQMCLQTQQPGVHSFDYDDTLLYITLAGILSWEGFHWYGLLSRTPVSIDVDEVLVDLLGPVQFILQTYIVVAAKRHVSAHDRNSSWIAYSAIYLLVCNFAHWCQDSYFITGDRLEKPGEHSDRLENKNLTVLAHILTPLIVFFRFHSATCFYHMWDKFNSGPRPT